MTLKPGNSAGELTSISQVVVGNHDVVAIVVIDTDILAVGGL